MLVLSRKNSEAVIINDNIRVVVVDIRGDKVKLGFEAPGEIKVHREEVWFEIQKERGFAAIDVGGGA